MPACLPASASSFVWCWRKLSVEKTDTWAWRQTYGLEERRASLTTALFSCDCNSHHEAPSPWLQLRELHLHCLPSSSSSQGFMMAFNTFLSLGFSVSFVCPFNSWFLFNYLLTKVFPFEPSKVSFISCQDLEWQPIKFYVFFWMYMLCFLKMK